MAKVEKLIKFFTVCAVVFVRFGVYLPGIV